MTSTPRSLVSAFAAMAFYAVTHPAYAQAPTDPQRTCYSNGSRTIERPLPGYREVPCPTTPAPGAQSPPSPNQPNTQSPGSTTSSAGSNSVFGPPRAPPAYVSPIPVPAPGNTVESVVFPDRWRVVDALFAKDGLADPYDRAALKKAQGESVARTGNVLDPYNRNVLKADRPVHDGDWFFNLGVLSDSVYELRDVPTPVGSTSTRDPGRNDVFGTDDQWETFSQNIATEFVYYKGDTVFQPPDYEFRFTPVFNFNYVQLDELLGVNPDPGRGRSRTDTHVGIQAAFMDKHLRNVSDNFDFDSLRIGIQPFSSDFRGFLFQDNQLGVRLFGTRHNNVFQYNLAVFRRLEKDTNSGLNDISARLRDDDVAVANLYWQDMPVKGFTSQATVLYNRNRESGEVYYNKNGFIERPASIGREAPRDYDVTYLGYNGDGHFGRYNLTASFYYALGKESPGAFVGRDVDIRAFFGALEFSVDTDWLRTRVSLAYGSGDDDPLDDRDTGFDAVLDNPQFAGADTSYWIRQAVPLVGGGRVALSGRNSLLNSLRSSKDEGQSNFTNPGVMLAGVGFDADVRPTLRLSLNVNALFFANTEVVELARNQGGIDRHIGEDISASLTWRPLMSQNIVLRASYARLIAGKGFDALFPDSDAGYFLLNTVFAY